MKITRDVRLLGLAFLLLVTDGGIWTAWPQTTAPILTVETGMHTASITDMAVDAANRYIVTVSNDKTARVWDISREGNLVPSGILRPPIDAGREGMLQAVGITPDGNTIACGGQTAFEGEGTGSIYLFDRGTGALTRRLSGLPGNIIHLADSPDGRLLAATMGRTGLRLYSVPDYTLSELKSGITSAIGRERLDVVVLNRAPVELAYAVIAHDALTNQRDACTRVEYEAKIMSPVP